MPFGFVEPLFFAFNKTAIACITLAISFFKYYRKQVTKEKSVESFVRTFGRSVDALLQKNPKMARILLSIGYQMKGYQYKYFSGKMNKANRMAASVTSESMVRALRHPENSAILSLFTPPEMLHAVGINPYSCEGLGCFLSGAEAERPFFEYAESEGLPETFCSYHKAFIGAAELSLMPKPLFIISTSLACDANMLTFRRLSKYYGVPHFVIDIPYDQSEDDILYVRQQLLDMKKFIEHVSGNRIDEAVLSEKVRMSQRSLDNYYEFIKEKSDKMILSDINSEMFSCFMLHTLLGTEKTEKFTELSIDVAKNAPEKKGLRLLWMHTNPFWIKELRNITDFNEKVQIVGCDMSFESIGKYSESDPYRAMAERIVLSPFNGPATRRIDKGIEMAKMLDADGVIWFCHWGCKHTLGASQIAKKKFEHSGFPTLILDGDGADRSHGGEGQVATRVEAFIEMLEERKG